MKKQFTILAAAICCMSSFFATMAHAQCSVTHVASSDVVVPAIGSGTNGTPTLSYTASPGSNRLVFFVLSFERDHTFTNDCNNLGEDFASTGMRTTTNAAQNPQITATWGGKPLFFASWQYTGYEAVKKNPSKEELSIEQFVFTAFESDIPAGGGNLVLGGDFQNPNSPGDEATFSASTFTNVGSYEYGGQAFAYLPGTPYSLSTTTASSSQPSNTTSADNMLVSPILFSKEGGTITASPGTLLLDKSVSNSGGTFATNNCTGGSNYTENDGIHSAVLLTTGAGAVTINASIDSPNPITGNLTTFRLVAAGGCILPVTLTSFTAVKQGTTALLNWATATEQNNRGFNVQRSTDGTNWATIGNVASQAANGNSSSALSYTYTDNQPLGGTDYYRLNQIDLDGKSTFSSTQTVVFGTVGAQVVVTPNPAPDATTVSGIAAGNTVRLVDMAGRVINTQIATGNTATIQLYNYPSGVYLVQVLNNGTVTTTVKLVKQ